MTVRSHRLARAAGLVALALLTGACVKADVRLDVRPDDQIDGSIVMAVDRGFTPPGGQAPDALLDQVGERVFHGTATGARQEPHADAQYVGRRVTIEGMSLLDFDRGTSDGGLKIVHQAGQFKLSGTVDTSDLATAVGTSATDGAARIARTFDVMIQVTFPGPVVQGNGTVSGDTVTWRPRLGQRLVLSAVASDNPGRPDWLLPIVAVVAAAAVGGVVVLCARVRRGGRPANRAGA